MSVRSVFSLDLNAIRMKTPSSSSYVPPYPRPLPALLGLLRAVKDRQGDLLGLLPDYAYHRDIGPLGYSRRSIIIANRPDLVRTIMIDKVDRFPKSDLMVNAVEPLIGDSIFTSSGETWRRQRAMIDPAFSAMRINHAFGFMKAAIDDQEIDLDRAALERRRLSLDVTMSHLTADVICRTVFSTTLKSQIAHEIFDDFTLFERSVAEVEIKRLIWDKAWTKAPQKPDVLAACQRIRARLGELIDNHLGENAELYDDMARTVIEARDPENGTRFTRDELIDELGVFFLAGHETTASALTWAFYIVASRPDVAAKIRAEVRNIAGDGDIDIGHTKRLIYTRNVFRETLRLYPPITFLPRVAETACPLGKKNIKKGALVMVAPWALHRHRRFWKEPNTFDPDRFLPEREGELTPGAYIPFGQGPRICAGAAFATIESVLILARLVRRYEFKLIEGEKVRPAARMTTRPRSQVFFHVERCA